MAQRCDVCGKGPQFGNRVSHAHNVTHRRFNPNLRRVRTIMKGVQKKLRGLHALPALGQDHQAHPRQGRVGVEIRPKAAQPRTASAADFTSAERAGVWGSDAGPPSSMTKTRR